MLFSMRGDVLHASPFRTTLAFAFPGSRPLTDRIKLASRYTLPEDSGVCVLERSSRRSRAMASNRS